LGTPECAARYARFLFPVVAADENGYRFYLPLASLACVEMVIIFKWQ
tara:strand:+ start:428 stop:568 length:141 start_codon:yes stop_codon:yes gene_type:complete